MRGSKYTGDFLLRIYNTTACKARNTVWYGIGLPERRKVKGGRNCTARLEKKTSLLLPGLRVCVGVCARVCVSVCVWASVVFHFLHYRRDKFAL